MLGETGENFAVKGDVFLFQSADEFAVRHFSACSERSRGKSGVDFDVPQFPEIVFLVAAVGEGVRAGVKNRLLRLALFLGAAEAVTFYLSQNIAAGFQSVYCFLYTSHKIIRIILYDTNIQIVLMILMATNVTSGSFIRSYSQIRIH